MVRSVGFDLDMTLVDTRDGIREALLLLAAETGRPVDVERIVGRLGPPIAQELAPWFGPDELADAVARFRVHLADAGVRLVRALPGAGPALAAVRDRGMRVVVVTSKLTSLAQATLLHAGLAVDDVVGGVWGAGKGPALLAGGAVAYVGDHTLDIEAARAGQCAAIAVASGSISAADLRRAGADLVLGSLEEFPARFPQLARLR